MRQALRVHDEARSSFSAIDMLCSFPTWYRSLASDRGPMADELPWLALAAIRYLGRRVRGQARVFEYGVGGSTLFFAKRAREVISVEHDPDWARKVAIALRSRGYTHCKVQVVAPVQQAGQAEADPADPDTYATSDPDLRACSFRDYAASIDPYPDRYFDWILIDGRARPACCRHALPKLARHGCLVWDNTERPTYAAMLHELSTEFERLDFYGPVFGHLDFSQTTLLKRRISMEG